MATESAEHPTIACIRQAFPDAGLKAQQFRGQTTLVVPTERLHEVMRFLRDDPQCDYAFFSHCAGVDYLDYPVEQPGRFAVVYNIVSHTHNLRLLVKTYLNPSIDTSGIEPDPALWVDSVCDLWAGAEWPEREAYDMFGIRFRNHPDLRRILTWEDYPAHPLRKDYPLRGRGEREQYTVTQRDDS